MSRDPGPKDVCDYGCVKGYLDAKNCPDRCKLNTRNGGASIDTHTTLDLALERVDTILVGVRFFLLALSVWCLVMVGFYFYG